MKLILSSLKNKMPKINFIKINDNAIVPSKGESESVGLDLTCTRIHKILSSETIMFGTDLKVEVEKGYYFEIVPRSSLSKTKYMLKNSIGVIDNSYQGELFVVLTIVDDELSDLVLPFKATQLILRKQEDIEIDIASSFKEGSKRGEGGFGSTSENNHC